MIDAIVTVLRAMFEERGRRNGGAFARRLLKRSSEMGMAGYLTAMEWLEHAARRNSKALGLSDKHILEVFPGILRTIPIDGARASPTKIVFSALAFKAPDGDLFPIRVEGGAIIMDQRLVVYDYLTDAEIDHRAGIHLLPNRLNAGADVASKLGFLTVDPEIVHSREDAVEFASHHPDGILVRNAGYYKFGGCPNWRVRNENG